MVSIAIINFIMLYKVVHHQHPDTLPASCMAINNPPLNCRQVSIYAAFYLARQWIRIKGERMHGANINRPGKALEN